MLLLLLYTVLTRFASDALVRAEDANCSHPSPKESQPYKIHHGKILADDPFLWSEFTTALACIIACKTNPICVAFNIVPTATSAINCSLFDHTAGSRGKILTELPTGTHYASSKTRRSDSAAVYGFVDTTGDPDNVKYNSQNRLIITDVHIPSNVILTKWVVRFVRPKYAFLLLFEDVGGNTLELAYKQQYSDASTGNTTLSFEKPFHTRVSTYIGLMYRGQENIQRSNRAITSRITMYGTASNRDVEVGYSVQRMSGFLRRYTIAAVSENCSR